MRDEGRTIESFGAASVFAGAAFISVVAGVFVARRVAGLFVFVDEIPFVG